MQPVDTGYRSFALLRMTGSRFVVILSGAKDLFVSLANCIKKNTCESLLFIPQLSVMSPQKSALAGAFFVYFSIAALAFSASTANAAGSEIASSDSILRLMSMPATFRPLISLE